MLDARPIRAWRAHSPLRRALGALFLPGLARGRGVLLAQTRWCHTFFMRFPLDCLALSSESRVMHMRLAVPACRTVRFPLSCVHILELSAGEVDRLGITVGLRLTVEPCSRRDLTATDKRESP